MLLTLESYRRNSAGSHLCSLRRVSRRPLNGISFRKSPRPSLPLKRAPPLTPTLSPTGKREETAPPRRSEPLRSKVGGPSKVSPDCTGWDRLAIGGDYLRNCLAYEGYNDYMMLVLW